MSGTGGRVLDASASWLPQNAAARVISRRALALHLPIAVWIAALGSTAGAQPADSADNWFDRGKQRMAAGKIAEACAAFDESQRLDPTIETLMNQANCRERNGELVTARMLFLEAVRQTGGGADRRSRQMHATATERAGNLEPRLSTLRIAVPDASRVDGLEVLRDGAPVDAASWNTALAIDGGTYTISARAHGRVGWSKVIAIGIERDAQTIEVPALLAASDARADSRDARTDPRSGLRSGGDHRWTARRKLALGLAAGSAGALATASVLGVLARGKQRDTHALCSDPQVACTEAGRANQLSRSAHRLATGANVGFAVAAGAAAAAVVLWLTGAEARGVAIAPAIAPGQLAVTAGRSW